MKEDLKILHLEDNDHDAEMVHEILELGNITSTIIRAKNKEEYFEHIEKADFDLVISDYNLPQFDGLKALIHAMKKDKTIPFIFCSGTIGEERAVQCLQLGAMDYVLKERIDKLVPAVNRALTLIQEQKERKKIHEELNTIRSAVEQAGEAIFITDKNGFFQYINPTFSKMYGWQAEEIIGKHKPNILKSGEHPQEFYKEFWEKLLTKKSIVFEMVNKSKDGKKIDIKNIVSPIVDKNNTITGYLSTQTDISLRKQHERETLQAKKEAEEMNKLKTYFLSNISHEMRTPLISILGFSEILVNELSDKDHKEAAGHIFTSGKRLFETINSILTLENIEKEKVSIKKSIFLLSDLINKIIVKTRQAAGKKGITVNANFDDKIKLSSDTKLVEKVICIILDNAVKFTFAGEINISTYSKSEAGIRNAYIKISDTGIGIAPEKINHIFKLFRQESEGLSRTYEGMGIGLTIAKNLMNLLNGEIFIKSVLGAGTSILLKFQEPLSEEEILKRTANNQTAFILPVDIQKNGKPHILIVEDNSSNRLLFNKYLKNDFEVDEAESGLGGITKASGKVYDLILMDINLGAGIDGIETLKRIKQLPVYEKINTPVIAITAFNESFDKKKFIDVGFAEYIRKPVSKDDLIINIRKIIAKHKT